MFPSVRWMVRRSDGRSVTSYFCLPCKISHSSFILIGRKKKKYVKSENITSGMEQKSFLSINQGSAGPRFKERERWERIRIKKTCAKISSFPTSQRASEVHALQIAATKMPTKWKYLIASIRTKQFPFDFSLWHMGNLIREMISPAGFALSNTLLHMYTYMLGKVYQGLFARQSSSNSAENN